VLTLPFLSSNQLAEGFSTKQKGVLISISSVKSFGTAIVSQFGIPAGYGCTGLLLFWKGIILFENLLSFNIYDRNSQVEVLEWVDTRHTDKRPNSPLLY